MEPNQCKDSSVRSKKNIRSAMCKIFDKKEIEVKKEESNWFNWKDHQSTQGTESSPQSRQKRPNTFHYLKQTPTPQQQQQQQQQQLQQQKRVKQQLTGKTISQESMSTVNTPIHTSHTHNHSNHTSQSMLTQKLIPINKNQFVNELSEIQFIPKQAELAKIFHKPVNHDNQQFYRFLTPNVINSRKEFQSAVYQKLAPLCSIYNQSQVFEMKRLNSSSATNYKTNVIPRYYFKQRKNVVEQLYGKQQAYQLIHDITFDKKIKMKKTPFRKNVSSQSLIGLEIE